MLGQMNKRLRWEGCIILYLHNRDFEKDMVCGLKHLGSFMNFRESVKLLQNINK